MRVVKLVIGDVGGRRVIIWKRDTIRSRDVFSAFFGDNYRTARLRPSVFQFYRRRLPLSTGSAWPGPARPPLPSDVIGNLRGAAGITAARWPAPICGHRRLNFRPLHIVMISTLIDGAPVRGAPLEINLRARDAAEIRRDVSRAMQSRFSEDLTTRRRRGARSSIS